MCAQTHSDVERRELLVARVDERRVVGAEDQVRVVRRALLEAGCLCWGCVLCVFRVCVCVCVV